MMENEDGEIVRVETKDTDGIALYKVMKECLVMLVRVDYEITEAILLNGLDMQVGMVVIGEIDKERKGKDMIYMEYY